MTRRSISELPKIVYGVNCWNLGCSPPEVLEANQKMWVERFAEHNHNKRRNVRRREQRRKSKLESDSDQEQQQRREPESDFDFGGPI